MGWIVWSVSAIFVRVFKENFSISFDRERNIVLFLYPLLCISSVYLFLWKPPTIFYFTAIYGILSAIRKIVMIHLDLSNIQSIERYMLISDCLFPALAPIVVGCLFEPVILFSIILMVFGSWVCCYNSLSMRFYLPLSSGEETIDPAKNKIFFCLLTGGSRLGEIVFLSYSVLNSKSPLLDIMLSKYLFSSIAVCSYNLFYDGSFTGKFSLLEAEYSFFNYILFSHKVVFNVGEIVLLANAIAQSPNPGYITLAGSFYLPILHFYRYRFVENYQVETLCIACYLQIIGLFFLFMLGRHLNEPYNVTSLAFVPN